jgi:hypothetical protein
MGLADLVLIVIGVVFVGSVGVAASALSGSGGQPAPLARARRLSVWRALVTTSTALGVFAIAICLHIALPLLEGVPFVLGPLAASVAGLVAFTLMPAPSIDGAVRRRTADVAPRVLRDYSTPRQRVGFIVLACATTGVALVAGLLSKPAEDGRYICTTVFVATCPAGGPYLFPGWLFAVPALALTGLLAGAVALALRRILRAPAAAWAELGGTDRVLRRGAVRLTLRVAEAALALTTASFLLFAALPLLNARVLETGLSSGAAGVRAHRPVAA